MEDYYEYLDSNGVTTLYKLIKDDTVALIDSYSVTINGITTTLDTHINDSDIHTPISDIENMVDTKIAGLVNSAPETLDTLKELSDALGNDPNFATTVANQIGNKANKDSVYTKEETNTLLEGKANSVHNHVVSDITDFPTIPTKLSQLENDMGFGSGSGGVITSVSWTNITDKPNFATVATSGSYNDLSNKPTIPNVYNKTLTIQKNGTNVATFTSNSNTDVTANITVPTKVSELSNDSGFITGISWDKVTNKPTLATVATSGSYTDLSNTPTIPTKVSQLENDMGFGTGGDTSDCVHKTGDETIAGVKKFTSDIARKYTAVDITTTPTSDMYAHINFTDKNDKTVAYIQYAQKTNGVDYIGLRVRDKNSTTWGVQLNTNKEFVPLGNNSYSLGSSSYKWADVYSTNAHITHTYTNRVNTYSITHPTDDSYFFMSGGSEWNKGANLFLYGISLTGGNAGSFELVARNATQTRILTGYPNGTLTWNGKNIALDENLVHRSGNETISGIKTFNDILKIGQGTLQVGSDSGYSVTYSWSGNITNKQPSGTFNISLPKANGTLAIDENLVHTSGNETIAGFKSFTEVLDRRNDVTISTVATATQLVDTNANRCGWIANRMHWAGNYHVHNRHIAYNENSGKEVYIDIISSNDGSGGLFVSGTATNRNLFDATSETGHTGIATMGWVNNPATSTNVVHRSGDEYINGNKIFSNTIHRYADLTTSGGVQVYRFVDTNANGCGHIFNNAYWTGDVIHNAHGVHNAKSGKLMQIGITSNDAGVGMAYIDGSATNGNLETVTSITEHNGIATMGWVNNPATSTNVVHRSGDETIAGNKTFLSGYATTPATTDNSTRIATTAWVRTYVNSVVGSGSVGASISAYYSNATTLTAEGNSSSSSGSYPSDYSNYINIAPTVGTIYTGSQLFSSFTPTASGTIFRPPTGSGGTAPYLTTAKATANFSGAFSSSAKYLCTTANAVRFRAYVSQGTNSDIGTASVVDNSSAKSIFIRVQ